MPKKIFHLQYFLKIIVVYSISINLIRKVVNYCESITATVMDKTFPNCESCLKNKTLLATNIASGFLSRDWLCALSKMPAKNQSPDNIICLSTALARKEKTWPWKTDQFNLQFKQQHKHFSQRQSQHEVEGLYGFIHINNINETGNCMLQTWWKHTAWILMSHQQFYLTLFRSSVDVKTMKKTRMHC